jgi:hypothetical protein
VITSGQGAAGTVSSVLTRVPPGPCMVMLSNAGTASPVYVGAGSAVTVTNGFPLPSGAPVAFAGYAGSGAIPLSVICSSGSASVGFFISSATGGTGP